MSIIHKLSISLGRDDEAPNKELALLIAGSEDLGAIEELIDNLDHQDKNIQSDCIKVLYEIAEQKPELIAAHSDVFLSLLDSKNNRLVWGAMTVLDGICNTNPDTIYKHLPKILDAADKGSVISRDRAVSMLIKLAGNEKYHDESSVLLLGQLSNCPPNQLPMYAENAAAVISGEFAEGFLQLLSARSGEFVQESKRKRVEKVMKRIKEQRLKSKD
jgi:hypothetical protein